MMGLVVVLSSAMHYNLIVKFRHDETMRENVSAVQD